MAPPLFVGNQATLLVVMHKTAGLQKMKLPESSISVLLKTPLHTR